MNSQRPPGAEPGDTILEAVVPIRVDGQEVQVTVSSALQGSPSPFPGLLGVLAGLAVVVAFLRTGFLSLPAMVAAAVLGVGLVEVFSVPPETGPPLTLWLPPLLAVLAMITALVVTGRGATNPLISPGLAVVAGVQLCVWAFLSRTSLSKPILPTDLPWPLHRFGVALALVTGLGLLGHAGNRVVKVVGGAEAHA